MKLTKAVLLAVLVTGLFACVGVAVDSTSSPEFTIGAAYSVLMDHAPSFATSVCGTDAIGLPTAQGTAHLSQSGYWTIRANADFSVTIAVTPPTGANTGVALEGMWNPGFDPDNDPANPPAMDHLGDTQTNGLAVTKSWQATTANGGSASAYHSFISTLVLNYGVHRSALNDPADTYVSVVTVTVTMP